VGAAGAGAGSGLAPGVGADDFAFTSFDAFGFAIWKLVLFERRTERLATPVAQSIFYQPAIIN
jgi:hypothetical protein